MVEARHVHPAVVFHDATPSGPQLPDESRLFQVMPGGNEIVLLTPCEDLFAVVFGELPQDRPMNVKACCPRGSSFQKHPRCVIPELTSCPTLVGFWHSIPPREPVSCNAKIRFVRKNAGNHSAKSFSYFCFIKRMGASQKFLRDFRLQKVGIGLAVPPIPLGLVAAAENESFCVLCRFDTSEIRIKPRL
ncbi:MAG: hypothetical protein ACOYM3_28945, partial [Terrimicrobiaceae bacterium]